jgi:hypothetical protein
MHVQGEVGLASGNSLGPSLCCRSGQLFLLTILGGEGDRDAVPVPPWT